MKLIGRGAFTKCYLKDCGKRVILVSSDPIKECMAWGWFPESPLFPEVKMIEAGTYEMDYIPPTRGLKAHLDDDQWQLYQVLRDCFSRSPVFSRPAELYHKWYEIFQAAHDRSESETVREGLMDVLMALDACANFGTDIKFEISPRNVRAVDGKLILVDCFFLLSKLQEVRSTRW